MFNQKKEVNLLSLPRRNKGKQNNLFKDIEITTNLYQVNFSKCFDSLFIFNIVYQLCIPHSKHKEAIFKKIAPQINQIIGNSVITPTNIYSTNEPVGIQFDLSADNETAVKIKLVKSYNFKENSNQILVFLNKELRKIMNKLSYIELGKTAKYFKSNKLQKVENFLIYNGYKINFVSLEKGLYLQTDVAKNLVRNCTVLEEIEMIYKKMDGESIDHKNFVVRQNLIGKTVVASYGKNCCYQINEIIFDQEISKFMLECDGKQISLKQYYFEKYKIKITKDKQPLLISIDKKNNAYKTILIPQLMRMSGIPKEIDQYAKKKVLQATMKPSCLIIKEIKGLIQEIQGNNLLQTIDEFGIRIDSDLTKINAKRINMPQICLKKFIKIVNVGKGQNFKLFDKPIFEAKYSLNVAIIAGKDTELSYLQKLIENTVKNLKVEYKQKVFIYSNNSVQLIIKQLQLAQNQMHNIALIIIPNSMKDDYSKIKIKAIDMYMITQILLKDTLKKKNFNIIATNILLQMNAKRGNILWWSKPSFMPDSFMLVAYDTAKINNQKTLLNMCCTINNFFSSIMSYSHIYQKSKDKFSAMIGLMIKGIAKYKIRNLKTPKQIVLFIKNCPQNETTFYHQLFAQKLFEILNENYSQNEIKLTIVVVKLNTSVHFFENNGNDTTNALPGTIVTKDIVSSDKEFYIMSQYLKEGTTAPTNYKIIYTNSAMQEEELQELIFSQCFNYFNWTGSIKVPGIVQYSKKAAKFKSKVFKETQVPEGLQSKLYFI